MSVSLLEVIQSGGYNPFADPDDARWLLSKQAEFARLIDETEEYLDELDRIDYDAAVAAELAQERADEARQALREDGEGDFTGSSEDPEFGGR